MKKMNLTLTFLILLMGLLQGGCVSRPSYPKSWSKVQSTDGCPNLEGVYKNRGECYKNDDYVPSLYELLISNEANKDSADYIEISQHDNELLIEAYKEGSKIEERVARLNSKDCAGGFIKLKALSSGSQLGGAVAGYAWESIGLSRATDNTLVVRFNSSGGAFVICCIPVLFSGQSWNRFLPYHTFKKNNELPNQELQPTVETPGESGNEQGTAAEL